MFVFHDSPADVDPLKLRKEVKRSGAYCPPPLRRPGGFGKNPEHVDPLHIIGGSTNPEHADPLLSIYLTGFWFISGKETTNMIIQWQENQNP